MLQGCTLSWYNLNKRGPWSGAPDSFLETVTQILDEFLTPAVATKAQQGFDRVKYTQNLGICAYICELQTLSNHIFMPIDEYTLQRQIVVAIPQMICMWLIEHEDLSMSTLTVVE